MKKEAAIKLAELVNGMVVGEDPWCRVVDREVDPNTGARYSWTWENGRENGSIVRNDPSSRELVFGALRNTDLAYLERCARVRSALEAEGSRYPSLTWEAIIAGLYRADWSRRRHAAVAAGCTSFVTDSETLTAGSLGGVVALSNVSEILGGERRIVQLRDTKDTGFVSAVVERRELPLSLAKNEKETWMIVGPNQDGRQIVYTFHPGEPIPPSRVEASAHLRGSLVTIREARALGLTHAKIAG